MQYIDTSDLACDKRAQTVMHNKHRAQLNVHLAKYGQLGQLQTKQQKLRLQNDLKRMKAEQS